MNDITEKKARESLMRECNLQLGLCDCLMEALLRDYEKKHRERQSWSTAPFKGATAMSDDVKRLRRELLLFEKMLKGERV